MKLLRPVLVVLLLALYAAGTRSSWRAVDGARHARDFATYYYATQVALGGGDPYDTAALSAMARAEGTRRSVHPYFYPPPFLLLTLWAGPLSLQAAYAAFFWLNHAFLWATLAVLRRWLGAPWLLLLAVASLHTPIADSNKMGQANLLVMLLAVAGLWRRSGVLVGAAAMAKMSPALYLAGQAARGWWWPVLAACAAAVGLSLLALPLVPLDAQVRFYTEILPGFSSGEYHGLQVPITLPANHSVPDLFNQLWPGPDKHHLDPRARVASQAVSLLLLAGLAWATRRARGRLGVGAAMGALTVLMVITPVYAYEHHLAMLVLPLVAAGAALAAGRLGPGGWVAWGLSAFLAGWPLYWLRPTQRAVEAALPALGWWVQESKFLGMVGLLAVCVAAALAPPGPREARP